LQQIALQTLSNESDKMNTPIIPNTVISFPSGSTNARSKVVFAEWFDFNNALAAVVTTDTPFHPVDHRWPDQPGDTGTMVLQNRVFEVVDSITSACSLESGQVLHDRNITAPRGDSEWNWFVSHIVKLEACCPKDLVQQTVDLKVDEKRRIALSAGHTASHLMGLALNLHSRKHWKGLASKYDSLGNPNLDQLAISTSSIQPFASSDHYRFGKSISKSGFGSSGFLAGLEHLVGEMSQSLNGWIQVGGQIQIDTSSDLLTGRREWVCDLPSKKVRMLCGGTHLRSLDELKSVKIELEKLDSLPEIIIRTKVIW
jgi:alanyl-tRNA synthetase